MTITIAFYMDQHVPYPITKGLRLRGIDVLRVQDDGRSRAEDHVILDRAMALGGVVFTQDDDFLALAHQRQDDGVPFNGVAFADDNVTYRTCIDDLEMIAKVKTIDEMMNCVAYIPL